MTHIPRASLCITILGDEDYFVLSQQEGGIEAFGVFTLLTLAGRERLTCGKSERVPGTDSLRFLGTLAHISAITHVPQAVILRCVETLAKVASETGSEPWAYLDDEGRLVIRSFFKFNTESAWGGRRSGAGRAPKTRPKTIKLESRRIQDEFKTNSSCNQDGIKTNSRRNQVESSGGDSGIGSGSGSGTGSHTHSPSSCAPAETPSDTSDTSDTSSDTTPPGEDGGGGGETEPFHSPGTTPPEPVPPKAIGSNSESETRRALDEAERLYPLEGTFHWVSNWLVDYSASQVVGALLTAHSRGKGLKYAGGILRNTKPEPAAPNAPTRPQTPVLRLSDEEIDQRYRESQERLRREAEASRAAKERNDELVRQGKFPKTIREALARRRAEEAAAS